MQDITEFQTLYNKLYDIYIQYSTQKKELENQINEIKTKLNAIDINQYEQVNALLQKMSEEQRKLACKKFEELGTIALQFAISPDYEMQVEMTEIRKRPSVNVYIVKKSTGVKTDPLTANGGGIVDIISIAMRIVAMQITDPVIDGPIIIDEPFKMVSKEYIPMLAEFLKKIARDFNRQIILITHNEFLAAVADQKFKVELGGENNSIVKQIHDTEVM